MRRTGRLSVSVATVVALVVMGSGTASADVTVVDADTAIAGPQSSRTLAAIPGATVAASVDLWIECTSKNSHMGASTTISFDAAASNKPASGSLSATSVTIDRPSGWPSDGTNCAVPAPATPAKVSTVTMAMPSVPGTYTYTVKWSTGDLDVNVSSATSTFTVAVGDQDGDTVPDAIDNCPTVSNTNQANADGDALGDACDTDRDGDGVLNATDNCPDADNADQANLDGDALGDVCDPTDDRVVSTDVDADGVADSVDNCPTTANAAQEDADSDGIGNACDSNAYAPTTPGTPQLKTGSSTPNAGVFTLTWSESTDADPSDTITYKLQRQSAALPVTWIDVVGAEALPVNEFSYLAASKSSQGTFEYRVIASDGVAAHDASSAASSPVKVDSTGPRAIAWTPDRSPEDSVGGWYLDSVDIVASDNGDPVLPDGSAGSGVDASTLPADVTLNTSGVHTPAGTVNDVVGNVSTANTQQFRVDTNDPVVSFSDCPTGPVVVGTTVTVNWSATDLGESGVHGAASGTKSLLTTASTGPISQRSVTQTVKDEVGHEATATCAYDLIQGSFLQPIDGNVINLAKAGRVVPVKIAILLNGAELPTPAAVTLTMSGGICSANSAADAVEDYSAGSSNTGSAMRYDTGKWIYNLATGRAGTCQLGTVRVGSTAVATFQISYTK